MDKLLAGIAIFGTALACIFGGYAFIVWVFGKLLEVDEE